MELFYSYGMTLCYVNVSTIHILLQLKDHKSLQKKLDCSSVENSLTTRVKVHVKVICKITVSITNISRVVGVYVTRGKQIWMANKECLKSYSNYLFAYAWYIDTHVDTHFYYKYFKSY